MKLTAEESKDWDDMMRMPRDFVGKRRLCPFKGQNDAHRVSYWRFRRWITQRGSSEAPAASTPLATGRQDEHSFELDTVCQRLDLDSPPRQHESAQGVLQGNPPEAALAAGVSRCGVLTPPSTSHTLAARGWPQNNAPEQGWVWRAAAQQAGSDERRHALQPFAVLDKTSVSQQGESVMKLAAPSLLNDYYANLLDCSCTGVIALALGSSVYLWDSQTRALVGHLDPSPQPGRAYHQTSVSCLSWSRDGRALCVGTRRGEIQAMGWCPWQRKTIATGGGWKDGELRVWDTESGTCVTSANTNSQICSLRWAEKKKYLVTGHGLPHHQVTCWSWDFPSLSPLYQLTGHSHRVLHLAINSDSTQIFSAGADQQFHIWYM
ncbi:cell division cycle 20.5, cofactor of APC complex-like isoform X3 [Sebastes umbrosus]|uniref:cell division cycle 20.5, cofactor of APC complex-like isoform X3 n=1 Tax=Sebastes umbrosus TaxID=72105 RepID=UPI00189FA18A|nr:cell division cycle 20.5, cofactor of APC complex-like isoform X3 [Sebastes umbrosus]